MTLIGLGYLGLLRLENPVSSHVIPLAVGSFRTTLVGSGWTVNKLTTLPYQTAHTGCPLYPADLLEHRKLVVQLLHSRPRQW